MVGEKYSSRVWTILVHGNCQNHLWILFLQYSTNIFISCSKRREVLLYLRRKRKILQEFI